MKASSYEFASTVLLSAMYATDKEAAEKHAIHVRSIANYRKALREDETFAEYFKHKKQAFDVVWAERLPGALNDGVEFIAQAARRAAKDPLSYRNPALIHAIAGATKLLAEVHYTGKLINARLATDDPEDRQPVGMAGQETTASPLGSEAIQ